MKFIFVIIWIASTSVWAATKTVKVSETNKLGFEFQQGLTQWTGSIQTTGKVPVSSFEFKPEFEKDRWISENLSVGMSFITAQSQIFDRISGEKDEIRMMGFHIIPHACLNMRVSICGGLGIQNLTARSSIESRSYGSFVSSAQVNFRITSNIEVGIGSRQFEITQTDRILGTSGYLGLLITEFAEE